MYQLSDVKFSVTLSERLTLWRSAGLLSHFIQLPVNWKSFAMEFTPSLIKDGTMVLYKGYLYHNKSWR
jgi:hypothetical protein